MKIVKKRNNQKVNLAIKAMFVIAILKLRIQFEVNGEFSLGNN